MNTGGSPSIGMPAYLISTPDILAALLERKKKQLRCVSMCLYVF